MSDTVPKNKLGDTCNTFLGHQKQVPIIAKCYLGLENIINTINVGSHASIDYKIQRIQYMYYLERIIELNFSLQNSLTLKKYSTVEALSRVALESSINLMYLLKEKDNERSMGLLSGHIKKNIYKAKKWNDFSVKNKDKLGIEHSNRLINKMEEEKKRFISSSGKEPKRWPDTIKKKFVDVELEETYLTVFASSSDSVHLGAEDIYNRTIVEFSDEKAQETLGVSVLAEQASFAIYLTICSFLHALEAVRRLGNKLNDDLLISNVLVLANKLNELKGIHERDHIEAN